jgi:hypothetical protein
MAKTINGLYKPELIPATLPGKRLTPGAGHHALI